MSTVDIIHADALEWIKGRDPRAWSVLLIDPPYSIDACFGIIRGKFNGVRIANDTTTEVRDEILQWWGDGAAAVFGSWKVPYYGNPRGRLLWDKGLSAGMGDTSFPWKPNVEDIFVYGSGWSGHRGSSVLPAAPPHSPTGMSSREHPHEKPVGLLKAILDKAPAGPVLDLTAGSGSTGVAAAQLGRPCTLVEIDFRWIPTIYRRLNTEGAQLPLVVAP